jgi:hypothetical protein
MRSIIDKKFGVFIAFFHGDMLPYMFRCEKVAHWFGYNNIRRTVGIWDVPSLIDGGTITAPRGGFYNIKGSGILRIGVFRYYGRARCQISD